MIDINLTAVGGRCLRVCVDLGGKVAELRRDFDEIWISVVERSQRLRQTRQLRSGILSDFVQHDRRCEEPSGAHYRQEESGALLFGGREREHVAGESTIIAETTVHLLAAGPGGLALGALAPRPALVLLQLVGAVEIRRIGRCVHSCADAEPVDSVRAV